MSPATQTRPGQPSIACPIWTPGSAWSSWPASTDRRHRHTRRWRPLVKLESQGLREARSERLSGLLLGARVENPPRARTSRLTSRLLRLLAPSVGFGVIDIISRDEK